MKRIFAILLAVMFATHAWAATTFTVDKLKYTVTDETNHYVSVGKGSTEPRGVLSIQEKVTNPNDGMEYTVTSFTNSAFQYCRGLTSVTIPNSVTNIGDRAFAYCTGLTSVTIPNSVTSMGSSTFYSCSSLTSVTISESVTSIGSSTFYGCSSLTSVTIPESVTSIGTSVFNGCGLTSVTIPESVTSISDYAFYGCSSLTSVTIPNSITNIGELSFYNCSNLTSVTIPNSVTSIGLSAFGNSGLTSVTIPESVTSIDDYAFSNCYNLTDINVERTNTAYTSENGVLFNKDKTNLVCYPNGKTETTYIILGSVTTISNGAFVDCSNLTSVTISNSVTSIGIIAFYGCISLTAVTIPESVTSIGDYAFEQCSRLTTVSIPNSVTNIGHSAFNNCKSLNYNIYDNAKYLGNDENPYVVLIIPTTEVITSCIINENCKVIGDYAFSYCSHLTSFTIPESVTSIGNYAFEYCSGLTTITIPESITNIGNCAFSNCRNLTSVTIPNSITSIGGNVFYGCNSLNYNIYDNIKYLGNSKNPYVVLINPTTSEITSCNINENCKIIGSSAFYGYDGLTSVSIPKSVTSIGNHAFDGCRSLTSICYEGSSEPSYHSTAFDSYSISIPVCVPDDYVSDKWCGFTNLIKGHNRVTDNAIAATCTETGLTEGSHCSYCGKVLVTQEVIPTLDHTYSNIVTNPTCTEIGYTTHTCSVCEFTYYSDTIDAKGHTADSIEFENTIAATCTTVGSYDSVVYCSVCQVELSRDEKEIPVIDHTYSTTVTAPTCTAVGYTTHTCSVCEYTYNSDTVASKGHKADSVEFENIVNATCTAAGSKDSVVFCSVCEVEISREEKGIPALGHTYSNSVTKPTCTAVGFTTHTCSVCNHTYNSDTIAANGHTEVIDAAIAATCTAAGKTEGKHCSVCNETIVAQTEIPALGHEFKDYIYNNDATTTADGTETATCERGCGATDTRTATGTKLAETPEKGTAVTDAATSALNIYAHGNTIVVENATNEISVYNAMGILICRDAIHRVRAEINVNAPGIYIVKVGGMAKRVMVN